MREVVVSFVVLATLHALRPMLLHGLQDLSLGGASGLEKKSNKFRVCCTPLLNGLVSRDEKRW